MKHLLIIIAFVSLAAAAHAEIVTETIDYEHDGVQLRGYFAYDDALEGPLPGVLVVHEWWGHNQYARDRAEMLASEGYAAFALDMFGAGKLGKTPQEAQALSTPVYTDRALMTGRARAGLDVLADHERTDAEHLAVIGYCFGGTVAIELARSGAPVDAAVAFHASDIAGTEFAPAADITGSVLVCNGAADVWVSDAEKALFVDEMEAAGVDYQFIDFGGAVHSFTNPESDERGMDNVAYSERADRRSWSAMLSLFSETLR